MPSSPKYPHTSPLGWPTMRRQLHGSFHQGQGHHRQREQYRRQTHWTPSHPRQPSPQQAMVRSYTKDTTIKSPQRLHPIKRKQTSIISTRHRRLPTNPNLLQGNSQWVLCYMARSHYGTHPTPHRVLHPNNHGTVQTNTTRLTFNKISANIPPRHSRPAQATPNKRAPC